MAEFTKGPSLSPQKVRTGRIWYYESQRFIEVFISADELGNKCGFNFTIPRRMLQRSLKRMLAKAEGR